MIAALEIIHPKKDHWDGQYKIGDCFVARGKCTINQYNAIIIEDAREGNPLVASIFWERSFYITHFYRPGMGWNREGFRDRNQMEYDYIGKGQTYGNLRKSIAPVHIHIGVMAKLEIQLRLNFAQFLIPKF